MYVHNQGWRKRKRDEGEGGGRTPPQILADQKTAAAASARRIITRHPRFSNLPPSLSEVNQYFIDPLSWVRLYFDSIRDREAKYADVCMLLCKMRGILCHFTA